MMTDIIKVHDMDQYFLVCIDALKVGLTRVLMEKGRVISCDSIKIQPHEQKYVTCVLLFDMFLVVRETMSRIIGTKTQK
jgi:hypothetical protein